MGALIGIAIQLVMLMVSLTIMLVVWTVRITMMLCAALISAFSSPDRR